MSIKDMAYDRRGAINRCGDLGRQFINHFKKILNDPNQESIINHADEMQTWLDDVTQIVLKYNKRKLTTDQIIDWFFTKGSTVEVLFENDENGKDLYNRFLKSIVNNYSVRNAFKEIGLLK